jgi:hypothetical protein
MFAWDTVARLDLRRRPESLAADPVSILRGGRFAE